MVLMVLSALSVGLLCRAMSKPTAQLLDAANRVLCYLSRHSALGLHYEGEPNELTAPAATPTGPLSIQLQDGS